MAGEVAVTEEGVRRAVEAGDAVVESLLPVEAGRGAGPGLGLPKKPINVDCFFSLKMFSHTTKRQKVRPAYSLGPWDELPCLDMLMRAESTLCRSNTKVREAVRESQAPKAIAVEQSV